MPEQSKPTPAKASRLIEDLTKVPNIIGNLGLSVAAAQKAFNLDYLEAMERVIVMAKVLLDSGKKIDKDNKIVDLTPEEKAKRDEFADQIIELVKVLAPSKYQFTETTLRVRLDLAQTMDMGASAGLGVSLGALAINAAFTVGYGYDYRAAAEVNTVIHAIPSDPAVFASLLQRAGKISETALVMPPGAQVDAEIFKQNQAIVSKLTGVTPAPEEPKPGEGENGEGENNGG